MEMFENFSKLHQQTDPLLVANVWNAQSARTFEKLNYKALATSSAAVAETLGYKDGEDMSFEEYLFVIRHIKSATTLPLSVDLEAGYGDTAIDIVENIRKLAHIGVAGINIEDSVVHDGARKIVDADSFAKKLKLITASGIKMFINVRCDAYLLSLPEARNEAIKRLTLYQTTGVHGLFLPCITDLNDIRAIIGTVKLPLNVMCMPGLPDFNQLKLAGVKRISMGNFLNQSADSYLSQLSEKILADNSFDSVFQK